MTETITLSERIEQIRLSYQRVKSQKLVLEDVAIEAAAADQEGSEIEEI